MYTCASCRGAAVATMEPGLVGVWQKAPLIYISLYASASVIAGSRHN